MDFADLLQLLRVRQWYKNLVILAAPFFSKTLAQPAHWPALAAGFFTLCLVSSAGYAFNDLFDRKADRAHPDKRQRPVASGRVKISEAVVAGLACALAGLAVAVMGAPGALPYAAGLLAFMLAYDAGLKKIAYLDITLIGFDFLLRAYAGAGIEAVAPTPAFLAGLFCLAIFLAVCKRRVELEKAGQRPQVQRAVYGTYTKEGLDAAIDNLAFLLMAIYAVFALASPTLDHGLLLVSLPFAFYAIWRYRQLAAGCDSRAAEPPRALGDWKFAASCAACALLLVAAGYLV